MKEVEKEVTKMFYAILTNGEMVPFKRKATIVEKPKRLGQRISWTRRNGKEMVGVIVGSFYYPGGGGYFVRLDNGKVVQCQQAFKIVQ